MESSTNECYLRAITEMGESHAVVTNQAVFTQKKIKLLEKGVRINTSLFDKLVKHKLSPSIDQCLNVENGVSPTELSNYAKNLLDHDPTLSIFLSHPQYKEKVLHAFNSIQLQGPLSFKLTVARCQRPEVFDHSIRVTLIALYLAIKSESYSDQALSILASSAMFHDIGILHVSKDLLASGRKLKETERHHLYAHPITGYLILRECNEYQPNISRPVFEHHERLDGSGYPRGLKGDDICLDAQILMLAEVANTVFERNPRSQSVIKLSILLRLNQKKFNRQFSNHLLSILNEISEETADKNEAGTNTRLKSTLKRLAGIFDEWKTISQTHTQYKGFNEDFSLLSIIDERISELQRTLIDAGFDMDHPENLIGILKSDDSALIELQMLTDETRWQLDEILHEIHRRLQKTDDFINALPPIFTEWVKRCEMTLRNI